MMLLKGHLNGLIIVTFIELSMSVCINDVSTKMHPFKTICSDLRAYFVMTKANDWDTFVFSTS